MARSKGSGSLVKRGKYFTAVWKVDGKVHTRSTKCTSKREALEKLEEFVHPFRVKSEIETLENLQTQINVLETERKKTPVEHAIKLFFAVDVYSKDINQSELSTNTISLYETLTSKLRKFTKKEYLYEITQDDADAFMQDVKDKNSVQSYNTYACCLKKLWYVCMKKDTNIRKNPFEAFKQLKDAVRTHRRQFTDEEIKNLLEASAKVSFQFGLFFKLGAYTGMRKEDCINLKKNEVDFDAGLIRRIPTKTKKTGITAIIPIADELRGDLKKACDESDCEYVIPEVVNMGRNMVLRRIKSVFDAVGIAQCEKDENGKKHHTTGFHSFRHTMTKKLYRQGLPVNVIMAIMGHKSINTSLHYGSAIENDIPKIDFGREMKTTSVKKELYAKVMSYAKAGSTFSEALEEMMKTLSDRKLGVEELKKAEEERKRRESEELDKMIDELMDEGK